jgi:hypothetical protein
MSKFLSMRVGQTIAIAICDRCGTKKYYDELKPDGNSPGLRVCVQCWDVKDPWRLPARKTEDITLHYPRPDDEVATNDTATGVIISGGSLL